MRGMGVEVHAGRCGFGEVAVRKDDVSSVQRMLPGLGSIGTTSSIEYAVSVGARVCVERPGPPISGKHEAAIAKRNSVRPTHSGSRVPIGNEAIDPGRLRTILPNTEALGPIVVRHAVDGVEPRRSRQPTGPEEPAAGAVEHTADGHAVAARRCDALR
jgi:hypothetical protein